MLSSLRCKQTGIFLLILSNLKWCNSYEWLHKIAQSYNTHTKTHTRKHGRPHTHSLTYLFSSQLPIRCRGLCDERINLCEYNSGTNRVWPRLLLRPIGVHTDRCIWGLYFITTATAATAANTTSASTTAATASIVYWKSCGPVCVFYCILVPVGRLTPS